MKLLMKRTLYINISFTARSIGTEADTRGGGPGGSSFTWAMHFFLSFVFKFIETSVSGTFQSKTATQVYRSYGRFVRVINGRKKNSKKTPFKFFLQYIPV